MNFRTLDLNLLRVFDVVMHEHSATRAAQVLAMTQPAVSNALKRLRDATGHDLFHPTSTGMTPTRQAEAMWPAVRAALDGLRETFEPQSFDPRHDRRSFTLAMADATAAVFVPPLLHLLQDEQAQIDLRFVPLTTRDPRPLLEQGEADVAVGFFPELSAAQAAGGNDGISHIERLYTSDYVCAMRRDHPLAAAGALTLDAYCAAQHLRVSFAGRTRGFVDEALQRLGRERRIVITVNQFFTAGSVVQQSDLLTVLPDGFMPVTGHAAQLACRRLPFELPQVEVSLLWHGRHRHDPAQRWLRERVSAAAAVAATIITECGVPS